MLPLQETGPGFVLFVPVPDAVLPPEPEDLDWPTLLSRPVERDRWLIPRSSILRSLTPEMQLAAFPIGDPHALESHGVTVEWSDGILATLRLERPVTLPQLLGTAPPDWPVLPLVRVAYELPPEEAQRDFAAGAVAITPEHFRYTCWALADWPLAFADDPPRLPHQAPPEVLYEAVENWLVLDEVTVEAARANGWRYTGELWRNPLSGALSDGAIFGQLAPGELGRIRMEGFHFLHLGQAYTSLVPFDLSLADPTLLVRRWSSNLPFPELPPAG